MNIYLVFFCQGKNLKTSLSSCRISQWVITSLSLISSSFYNSSASDSSSSSSSLYLNPGLESDSCLHRPEEQVTIEQVTGFPVPVEGRCCLSLSWGFILRNSTFANINLFVPLSDLCLWVQNGPKTNRNPDWWKGGEIDIMDFHSSEQ